MYKVLTDVEKNVWVEDLIYQIRTRSWYGEGDDGNTGGADGGAGGDAGSGDGGSGDSGGGDGSSGGSSDGTGAGDTGGASKTFTQEQVNQIMAQNRRNLQTKVSELESQLAEAQSGALSAEERVKFTQRVKELSDSLKTKEELARQEQERIRTESEAKIKELETNYNTLQERYVRETITRAITDAAVQYDAFAPDQIVALLSPNTRLVEEIDEENNPTGNLIPMAKITGVNEDEQEVELDLKVGEAVKVMSATPAKYGNLFKSNVNGGLGFSGVKGSGGGTQGDLSKLSTEEYMRRRKEGKIDLSKA